MSSLSYWEARKAKDMFRHMEQADRAADGIAAVYLKASRHMSLELDQIFEKFQSKHGLTQQEAKQLLNTMKDKISVDALKEALRAGSGDRSKAQLLAELESPAYQARLERLQQLQDQIDLTMRDVYHQEKVQSTSHYVNLASDAYYKNIFNVQSQTGIGFGFDLISPAAIDQIINSKWSGANYSTRIWSNTQALAQELKEELLVNMVTGRTDRETAEIIADRFAVGASQARRLVRTESCNMANQMDMAGYEECGIEKYRYVATLDLRTSSICREMDGKVFPVSKQQPGLNCPPMHPWCRSTTICEIGAGELSGMQRRARDPVTGKNIKVPANMTYEQWYDKNVKGHQDAELNEKMIRNRSSDRRQLERYKEVMGKDAPKTLDSFQKIKYTDSDKWENLKDRFKNRDFLQGQLPYQYNGENLFIPAESVIRHATTIAGDGVEMELRAAKRLSEEYGGHPKEWKKRVGQIQSGQYLFDVHWYELNGIQYDAKVKTRKDR